jgi:hypothetical protein
MYSVTCEMCGGQKHARISDADNKSNPVPAVAAISSPVFTKLMERHRSRRDDRCTERGCTKTVGDHIEEFRASVSKVRWGMK